MSKRVNVTIPSELEGLLDWFVRYDPRFAGGNLAAAVAHFFSVGLQAEYERGLREAEPMDADEFTVLAEDQRTALAMADQGP